MVFIGATLVLSILTYLLFGDQKEIIYGKKVNAYKELKRDSELSKDYIEKLINGSRNPWELKWVLAYLYKNDKTVNLYLYDRVALIKQTKKKQEELSQKGYLERIIQNYKEAKLG